MKKIAYIALGSNLDNPKKQVQTARYWIAETALTTIVSESSLYETVPLGSQDQPNYINQVIAVETQLSAHDLLKTLFF